MTTRSRSFLFCAIIIAFVSVPLTRQVASFAVEAETSLHPSFVSVPTQPQLLKNDCPPNGDPSPHGVPAPNLFITDIRTVDGDGNPITPTPGTNFGFQIEYMYQDPTCDFYTFSMTVNGWETAPGILSSVDTGCGGVGTGPWLYNTGLNWMMLHGGTYNVSATIDADNAVLEINEGDNTFATTYGIEVGVAPEWDLTHVDQGRTLLGDGTNVIIGTMDDALDINHPWYAGLDSLGQPRLAASLQNALGDGGNPINVTHATSIMSVALARGANSGDLTGYAPDARYVTAEFIDREGAGHEIADVLDAAGFMVQHDVDVINMSWWLSRSDDATQWAGEAAITNLMADYLAWEHNIVCVAALSYFGFGDPPLPPHAPSSSRNVISVGGLDDNLIHAWSFADYGPTPDGRSKPDVLGNDALFTVAANWDWRSGLPAFEGFFGTDYTAPHVTGAVAQMLDYGKQNNESLDHRVIKAIVMNSGQKRLDIDSSPWSNSVTQPLDDQQGTGVIDMLRVHAMYSAGEQNPANPTVPGYDFGTVAGNTSQGGGAGTITYQLGAIAAGASFSATLAWDRHTYWDDANESETIDTGDSFYTLPTDAQDNLDLVLYRNGNLVAQSRSTGDTVEHIYLTGVAAGNYTLVVERLNVADSGTNEDYGLAWDVTIPAPVPCAGDLNDDDVINGRDIQGWIDCLLAAGPCTATDTDGDSSLAPGDLADDTAAFVVKMLATEACPP